MASLNLTKLKPYHVIIANTFVKKKFDRTVVYIEVIILHTSDNQSFLLRMQIKCSLKTHTLIDVTNLI
jgi:hypothetical protein